MAENFNDARNVKKKRGNFMGSVREVSSVPVPKTVVEAPSSLSEDTAKPDGPIVAATTVEPEEKTALQKGFVVGYTDEGIVKLQPFGGLSELELVGLVEYARTKSKDMLGRIARTSISDIASIKEGVIILAQLMKTMLAHDQDRKADS